jgi:HPt (histidine-containing phosphotransfer) domain-containing protein
MEESQRDESRLIFDRGELLARVENDFELLGEIVRIFKQDFPSHLFALREAVKARDGKSVASVAHTLKGMLSNLAAIQATGTVARLEQLGRKGEASRYDEVFAAFEDDASKLMPLLEACMSEECR